MATPIQLQVMQPQQHFQQQLVQQQPGPMMQQAQFVQQPQMIHSHTNSGGCCSPHGKALSIHFRPAQLGLGICIILIGVVSVLFGIIGIFTARSVYYGYNYVDVQYNPTALIGANIWAGLFQILCGIFAIVTRSKQINIHLMNTFYAFSLMTLLISLAHIIITGIYFSSSSVYNTIWFNIVSMVLGINGFAFSLTFTVFLSRDIYCKTSPMTGQFAQYHGTNQLIALQQYPNQPVLVPAYQPVQATSQPVQAISQPVQAISQPVQAISQPVQIINQPVQAIEQPVQTINQDNQAAYTQVAASGQQATPVVATPNPNA